MLDFVIILLFILAAAGIGFDSVELLPVTVQDQVTNLEALRWITAGFGAIIGFAIGLTVQVAYRRLEARVRQMPIEVILTRAVGLVLGLLLANLMLAPIFLLPIPFDFTFIKPLVAILGSVM
ncbi:MAG: PIN/TRAM domain-containing protein, partial [Tolypothrix sp. T3-bin4]|nr:PIN/TRAM domain-containing protein [Tolypothrix sp. T3-bin4]